MHSLPIASRNPLVSTTSILILSGFLVLVPLVDMAEQELSPLVMGTGLVGLLSYIAFQIGVERQEQQERISDQAAAHRRLNKHLTTPIVPPINYGYDPVEDLFSGESPAAATPTANSAYVG